MKTIDFRFIAAKALKHVRVLLDECLPGGRIVGREYIVRNPTRDDKHAGSFLINIQTGRWADFATSDKGGDLISLYAYVKNVSQAQAARIIANKLRLDSVAYRRQRTARCR